MLTSSNTTSSFSLRAHGTVPPLGLALTPWPALRYPKTYFRRRYRMRRKLFLKIVKCISTYEADPLPDHFNFFRVRPDATGRMSLSVIMKCTAAIRQLAYGTTPDAFDEYLQMSERTAPPVSSVLVNGVGYDIRCIFLGRCILTTMGDFRGNLLTVAYWTRNMYFTKASRSVHGKMSERAFGVHPKRWGIIQTTRTRSYLVNTFMSHVFLASYSITGFLKDQKMMVFDWNEVYANPSRNMQRTGLYGVKLNRRKQLKKSAKTEIRI
ncbi:hypothetical protein Tco_1501058 [Tanacetum coccineum]